MEEVVAKEEQLGEDSGDKLAFPSICSLKLVNLPKLRSFYSGNLTLECPSLSDMWWKNCTNMHTFSSGLLITPKLSNIWADGKTLEVEERACSATMAHNPRSVLAFLFILNVLLAIAGHAVAGRDIPTDSKNTDMKQPEWFIEHDRSVLIPGFGRVMVPKLHKGEHFNPFTYNPVTGTSGGSGGIGSTGGSGIGTVDGGSHNYVPGGDDTLVPNPGVEVPNPGSGGGVPAAARP
ncbi:hypothetical protein F0562_008382 [Nyssa sinensis]|uniref:Uncharacterized protein n=1 Tax=Nyssa sinensis TaxID=561372 RepID=A0A5J5A5L6_9ASTE|nr:hypothetical protein F0562_008382 [Nyssa sinensis]